MQQTEPSTPQAEQARDAAPEGSIVRGLCRTLAKLSGETASSTVYYKRAAAEIVRAFNSPYGAISVRFGAEVVEDYWHQGSTDPRFWKKPIDELLNESLENGKPIARQFTSRDAKFHIALMSVLLRDIDGSMIGVLSLVVRCDRPEDAPAHRELLESICHQVAMGAARAEALAAGKSDDGKPGTEMSKVASYRSGTELAFALVSSLRNKFGCEQAAIGLATGSRVRVVAVSGIDEFSEQSAAGRRLRDAMGEAVDADRPIFADSGEAGGYAQHARWLEHGGRGAVASVPVAAEAGTTVVVSLRRAGDLRFREDELEQVTELVQPYAPAFDLINRATRSVAAHTKQSVSKSVASLVRPGGWGRKVAAVLVLGLGGWIAFGSLSYSVSAGATIEPAQTRFVSAPFAGALEAVLVAPGDLVEQGQVLAQLDVRDLRLERVRVAAEAAIARIDEDRAIAEADSVNAALARAEQRRASARLEEIDRKIERSRIVAPFSGRIVEGDVRRRVGESLPMGEMLFRIADTSSWKIEAAVPQRVSDDLELGRVGTFASAARPEHEWDVSIERIRPTPEIRNGKAVYLAEAALTDAPAWFKPGMEGSARIQLGERPVWWIMSNRVTDYFRMNFWL